MPYTVTFHLGQNMICFLTGPWVIVPPGEHPGEIVPHRQLINIVKTVQQLQQWSPIKENKTNKPHKLL